MKTSRLKKFAWAFFVLAVTTGTVFGQGWRGGNRNSNQQNGTCLTSISGLTDEQKSQIQAMDEKHWEMMEDLRVQRRSTTNAVEKSEIRTNMLKAVEAHRNAVKALMTEEQQSQYDQLHPVNAYGPNQNVGNGAGNKGFRGQGTRNAPRGYSCNGARQNGRGNRSWSQNPNRGACIYN